MISHPEHHDIERPVAYYANFSIKITQRGVFIAVMRLKFRRY